MQFVDWIYIIHKSDLSRTDPTFSYVNIIDIIHYIQTTILIKLIHYLNPIG